MPEPSAETAPSPEPAASFAQSLVKPAEAAEALDAAGIEAAGEAVEGQ